MILQKQNSSDQTDDVHLAPAVVFVHTLFCFSLLAIRAAMQRKKNKAASDL